MSAATAEVLRKARAKIAHGWTQGQYAIDADGAVRISDDPAACKWCAIGAIFSVDLSPVRGRAYSALSNRVPDGLVAEWNDVPGRTQAEVFALYDSAIAAEEAAP